MLILLECKKKKDFSKAKGIIDKKLLLEATKEAAKVAARDDVIFGHSVAPVSDTDVEASVDEDLMNKKNLLECHKASALSKKLNQMASAEDDETGLRDDIE